MYHLSNTAPTVYFFQEEDRLYRGISEFLGGDFELSREETKYSSELLFHSSEVPVHSSELLFPGSVENFRFLPRYFRFPREWRI